MRAISKLSRCTPRLSSLVKRTTTPLNVAVRGPGEPEIIVVGGIHGDETGGVHAVRRLREADLPFQRGVALVLANESAIDAGTRFINSDLNRVFPGDPTGDHEERLAAHLCSFIHGKPTLSLHGTRSKPTPFALISSTQKRERELVGGLPVDHVVDYAGVEYGTLARCGVTVEVEVGAQGTERAAVEAEHQTRAFLQSVDALPGDPPRTDPQCYRMFDPIQKPPGDSYEVLVSNFTTVEIGDVFARVDGRPLIAEESFTPVLLSADGYPNIFGYKGRKIGETLDAIAGN